MSTYFIDGRENIKTILTDSISLNGDLSFETSLEIHGHFTGTIRSKGLLVIAKTAVINGNIYSKDLIVQGKVTGDLLVFNRLSVEDEAQVLGNIITHKIKVTNKVTIDGDCSTLPIEETEQMFKNASPETFFRENYSQIKSHSEPSYSSIFAKKLDTPSFISTQEPSKDISEDRIPDKKKYKIKKKKTRDSL